MKHGEHSIKTNYNEEVNKPIELITHTNITDYEAEDF